MLNMKDIMETITMIQEEHLDIRTITMGISLLDCCDTDIDKSCEKVYEKICRLARQPCSDRGRDRKEIRYSHRKQASFRNTDRYADSSIRR